MMNLYHVKSDLPGLPAGSFSEFSPVRAAMWGSAIEPFDAKKHGAAKARQESETEKRRLEVEKVLALEREHPDEYQAREAERRESATKALIAERRAELKRREDLGYEII